MMSRNEGSRKTGICGCDDPGNIGVTGITTRSVPDAMRRASQFQPFSTLAVERLANIAQ
jgi:hypothetical protein